MFGRLSNSILYTSAFFPDFLIYAIFVSSQTTSSALKGAIQLGITHTVGSLSQKAERDVLMQDFYVVESIFFPRCEHILQQSYLICSFI